MYHQWYLSSFELLIPVIITLVLVCSINYCFTLTSFGNIHALVNEIIQKPLLLIGTGLPALLISQGLAQLLCFLDYMEIKLLVP